MTNQPQDNDMPTIECQWFARCTNETTEAADHPVLGPVPICRRCQQKLGITPEFDIRITEEATA